MGPEVLIDTNVIYVAGGEHPEATIECQSNCVDLLERVKREGVCLLDSLGHILEEYLRRGYRFPQHVGDLFIVHLVTHQSNEQYCRIVSVSEDSERGYVEFPADAALKDFDRSDRKFVAVAVARGGKPPIHNAVDSDWRVLKEPLKAHVRVEELCG